MTDHRTVRSAREPAVGHQQDLLAKTLTDQGGSDRKHFPHARSSLRTLVSDDDRIARVDVTFLKRIHYALFSIEDPGGPAQLLTKLVTCHLQHGAVGGQVAEKRYESACL